MTQRIVIGTRGSELALAQTRMVEQALRSKFPELAIDVRVISTSGDEASTPITDLRAGRKGAFTAEIERGLQNGEIDLAVHSAKDLPSELTPGTTITAALPRAAVQDFLISLGEYTVGSLPRGGIVATGSVRRRFQLLWQRPDLDIVDLRGNVPTRLRKLARDEWHAAVFAAAGLERLGVQLRHGKISYAGSSFIASPLPVDVFVPAGGQGIIAIQTRAEDEAAQQRVSTIDHAPSSTCLRAEREFLRLLAVDCNAPVGVHATIEGETLMAQAQVFDAPGKEPRRATVAGPVANPEKVAADLLGRIEHDHEHEQGQER